MLKIADHTFSSRLFTGTGKFARPELMAAAIEASGSQLVTMAIKRLEPGKLVTHRFTLDQIADAYATFGDAAHTQALKVIISADAK